MPVTEAPGFENAKVCSFCKAGFSLVKRKHHCRNCGKTACDACSSKSVPIPAFGFVTPVRVCDACCTSLQSSAGGSAKPQATSAGTTSAPAAQPSSAAKEKAVFECVCGMPLCICAKEAEEEKSKPVKEEKPAEKPKAAPAPASKPQVSSFFTRNGGLQTKPTYDLKGDLNEQCRDAVKNKDLDGVKMLLANGADAKYTDRTGNTLAHLAAMFDRFDIVSSLHEAGADIYTKNPAGETAVDLAPPSLQFKMEQLTR